MSLRRVTLVCAFLLPLTACSFAKQPATPSMAPEDVLRNAAQASLRLESARYDLAGEFSSKSDDGVQSSGTAKLSGVLQDAGKQLNFRMKVDARTIRPQGDDVLSGDVEVMVGGDDVFMKLYSLTFEGTAPFFRKEHIDRFVGTWWRFPSQGGQAASLTLTPDPRLLNAQAQVVNVVRDRGVSTLRDRTVYRYDVAVDREKLVTYLRASAAEEGETFDEAAVRESMADLAGEGTLWIDTETYYVQRLEWNLSGASKEAAGAVSVEFTVDFFDHDRADPIVPPGDAQDFSPFMLLDAPEVPETSSSILPPAMEEELLQQLLREDANTSSPNFP